MLSVVCPGHASHVWDCSEALSRRAIQPLRRVNGEWNNAFGWFLLLHRLKQSRLAQLDRKLGTFRNRGIPCQFIDPAVLLVVIEDEQLAIRILAKVDDSRIGFGNRSMPFLKLVLPLKLGIPYPARFPVAADVMTDKVRELLPAVNGSTGERCRLGV